MIKLKLRRVLSLRNIAFLFFIFFALLSQAQNLVPNPSFENLKINPPGCWPSGSKSEFENTIFDWTTPNDGTTDILSTLVMFNSCLTYLPTSTYPYVDWFPRGNQLPRTGNNVVGIKPLNENRREYLEVELLCNLIPGKEYYCEMYVSLAENTNYAQNSLGMYFSDTLVYQNSFAMLNFTPQIVESAIIDDTINWVKIAGTFTATGTQRYLIIGSFADDAQVQTSYLGNKGLVDFTYYYIDDVLVRPVDPPEISIIGDTIVCEGDKVHLQASGANQLVWKRISGFVLDSGSTFNYKPASSMNIKVNGVKCNWPVEKEINLTVLPSPDVKLGKDTIICSGSSIVLDAGSGFDSYLWNTGQVSQSIIVSNKGYYSVMVTNIEGCEDKDKIEINYYQKPFVNLGSDINTCKAEGIFDVATGQKGDTYLWQDNSSSSSLQYTEGGTYWVTITNACGNESTDSIQINTINMFLPNLITANGDDKNDQFEILGIEDGKGSLKVYNRYGENIYNNGAYNNTWTGEELSDGIYYYIFSYPTCETVKGWVQLIKN